jgi:biopolymer transport protein ExbD
MRDTESWMAPRPQAMAVPMIGLLVMLLATTMVITPAIHGPKLPAAAAGTPVPRSPVAVGVDRDGQIWIVGAAEPGPVPDDRLAERLRHAYAVRGDGPAVLHLVADRFAPYARVQTVTRAAAELGIRDIELIVECPRGRESLLRACHR